MAQFDLERKVGDLPKLSIYCGREQILESLNRKRKRRDKEGNFRQLSEDWGSVFISWGGV